MKLKLHEVEEELASESGDNEAYYSPDEKSYYELEFIVCSYEGTDFLTHKNDAECISCAWDRVVEAEQDLDWYDSTEYWEFSDWWESRYISNSKRYYKKTNVVSFDEKIVYKLKALD